jgi:hypothetical protein
LLDEYLENLPFALEMSGVDISEILAVDLKWQCLVAADLDLVEIVLVDEITGTRTPATGP